MQVKIQNILLFHPFFSVFVCIHKELKFSRGKQDTFGGGNYDFPSLQTLKDQKTPEFKK